MKKIILLLIMFVSVSSYSQVKKKTVVPKFDFSHPEQIMDAIIYVAKTKNYSLLYNLCDPQEKGDIESLCLCRLSSRYKSDYANRQDCTEMTKEYFNLVFGKAKNPVVLSNDGLYAVVEYDVENVSPTINLVKRGNRWYIFSLGGSDN